MATRTLPRRPMGAYTPEDAVARVAVARYGWLGRNDATPQFLAELEFQVREWLKRIEARGSGARRNQCPQS